MTQFTAPAGENVDQVRDALDALKAGTGSFEAVAAAVAAAKFAVRPANTSLDDIWDNYDYTEMPDTFNDVVNQAYFERVLTKDQVTELRRAAKFMPAPPSRLATPPKAG